VYVCVLLLFLFLFLLLFLFSVFCLVDISSFRLFMSSSRFRQAESRELNPGESMYSVALGPGLGRPAHHYHHHHHYYWYTFKLNFFHHHRQGRT
jgi:hypothetical protein